MGSNKPRPFEDHYIPEPMSGCFLWLGSPADDGYGMIGYGGRNYKAHRFSWMIHRGPIPPGMHVLHKCDTPACVNPAHLFLGNQRDNNRDRDKKKRSGIPKISGEKSNFAKLTEADVRAILVDTRTQVVIAKDYGIRQGTVSHIKCGTIWKHITLSDSYPPAATRRRWTRKKNLARL